MTTQIQFWGNNTLAPQNVSHCSATSIQCQVAATEDKNLALRTSREVPMLRLIFQHGLLPTDSISSFISLPFKSFSFFKFIAFIFSETVIS
jgi:hypothetical protein